MTSDALPTSAPPAHAPDVLERLKQIRVVLFDVDGVLTDGGVYMLADGGEARRFDIKDGAAIVMARRAGLVVGAISARHAQAVQHRARHLGLDPLLQGVSDKGAALRSLMDEHGWSTEHIAYMGDDVVDLPVLTSAGLAACPSDAVPEVRAVAHIVTRSAGGHGAARALIEDILRAQGRWDAVIAAYVHERP